MSLPSTAPETDRCADCGGLLLDGTCAACAFGWMRASGTGAESGESLQDRYQLLECLARGGMGVVYAARDTALRRMVALKVLRGAAFAGAREVARFTLETKAAAALDHPHIVPVYEVGEEDGEPFFTMKLIDGQSLAERLRAQGPLSPREAAVLLVPVARAVEHAHVQGVLHRDLKPGNILLDSAGRPWLTDFGLAKFSSVDSGLTGSTDTLGTPHYMPPEMAAGRAREFTPASDVWALGVILWEMAAGTPPFTGQSAVEILQSVVRDELPAPPESLRRNRDLLTIARRCMEKRPSDRLASAKIVADELERFLRDEPILSHPASPLEMLGKWMRRRPLLAVMLALGVIFLTVSSLLWLRAEKANISLTQSYGDLAVANDRLKESLQRATATRLASEARLQVEENPDRALLLAARAAEMRPGGKPQLEAEAALMEVLQQTGGLDCTPSQVDVDHPESLLHPSQYYAGTGQISPDSRWLVVISATEYYLGDRPLKAALLDLKAPDRAAPVRCWSLTNSGKRATLAPASCWLPDSRGLVILDGQAAVRLVEPLAGLPPETGGRNLVNEEVPPSRQLGFLTPPQKGQEMTIHALRMTAAGSGESGTVRLAICWRAGPRCDLQLWEAGPDGLIKKGEARIPVEVREDAVLNLSPQGRWMVFGTRDWAPLMPDGTNALLYDGHDLTLPPLRLLTDPALAAAQTTSSRDLLASSQLQPEFGSIRNGAEDMVVLPHPGHGLHIHDFSGKAPGEAVPGRPLPVYPSRLRAFALSPDSRAVAELRQGYGVIVHQLAEPGNGSPSLSQDARMIRLPDAGEGSAVAFSPDNQWVFAARKNVVNCWWREGLTDGQRPLRLLGSAPEIGRIGLSPDSRTLFTTGSGWVMRRWQFDGVTTGLNPREIAVPGAGVREIALSPDRQWLAAACEGDHHLGPEPANLSQEGWVAAGRLDSPRLTPLAAHGEMATGTAFSPDGQWLAAAGGSKVRVWRFPELAAALDKGAAVLRRFFSFGSERMLPQYDARVTWFPDGKLYCVHGGGGDLQWDFTNPDPQSTTLGAAVSSILYLLPAVALSPDERFLAVARHGWDEGRPVEGSMQEGNQVLLFDGTYGRHNVLLHALRANFLSRTNLAFSPDGRWLAAGGEGKPATLWDLNAPDIAASRRPAPVTAALSAGVAFSPDSHRLAIGTGTGNGSTGTLNLWDFQNPDASTAVLTIRTPQAVSAIVWHPDGRLLTGGTGASVAVRETDLTKLIRMAHEAAGRSLTAAERARHGL